MPMLTLIHLLHNLIAELDTCQTFGTVGVYGLLSIYAGQHHKKTTAEEVFEGKRERKYEKNRARFFCLRLLSVSVALALVITVAVSVAVANVRLVLRF